MSRPPLALEYVEWLVWEQYGIDARAQRLTGDRDENFRMLVGNGAGYVFKVVPAGESAAMAGLVPSVLLHLENVAADLPVPRLVRTADGRTQVIFSDASGEVRSACLCTFLSGKQLMSATRSAGQRRACGRLLARLAQALRSFESVAAQREVAWDVARVPNIASLIPRLPELPSVGFLQEFVAQFTAEIAPRLAGLRHQFVHNDFNARNIIVDAEDDSRVAGIIDFGDAVYTALVADVAVGVTGQLATPETADEAAREFVAAYCEVEPLRVEELAILDWLIAGRIVLNVVLTAWHRNQYPTGGHFDGFDASFFEWRVEFAKRLVSPTLPFKESGHVRSCLVHR